MSRSKGKFGQRDGVRGLSSQLIKCSLFSSKEHQKLHWRTHKNHCRGAPTKDASPEENLESAPEAGTSSTEHSSESMSQLQLGGNN